MDNSMDNTKQEQVNKEHNNGKIPVTEVGQVCVFCGNDYAIEDYEVGCCGEVRHETGYETIENNPELILESELTENHVVIDEK